MKPEAALHRAVADYLAKALAPPTFWTTIGHGGGGLVRGRALKRIGMKAGVPDLLIVHDGKSHWIELKSDSGRLSKDQQATIDALEAAGCYWELARSLQDVADMLMLWGIPVRARVAA